jgi:ribosomal protein L11 methyltransferase
MSGILAEGESINYSNLTIFHQACPIFFKKRPLLPQKNPPKIWTKVTIDTPAVMSDTLAGFLTELCESGIEQSTSGPEAQSLEKETITGYWPHDEEGFFRKEQLTSFLNELPRLFPGISVPELTITNIEDEDWNRLWKENFKPFHITESLVVKPSWEDYTTSGSERMLTIDPGMAFGTGHHASTKLALELIEKSFQSLAPLRTVLDVGTGTGILAMAAALFGAESVQGVDNDLDAVAVGRQNVNDNNLVDKVTITSQNIATITDTYDLVIANIIHDTLIELAFPLIARMRPSGLLILAGILIGTQSKSIVSHYTGLGLTLAEQRSLDEWSGFCFEKKTP